MTTGCRILVLGAGGMLGNAVLRFFAKSPGCWVIGSVRSPAALEWLPVGLREHIVSGVDVECVDSLIRLFADTNPHVVVNCIGLVKQLADADNPLVAIPINSLLPHRLAWLCSATGARLIHISTDCVFSGKRGMYREEDPSDALDLYGRSKHIGEVDYPHAVTLRTSLIGHELNSSHGLIGWFLAQQGSVKGFERAVFSGLPTVELARVMRDFIIPNSQLRGIYHVAAQPINKYEVLKLIAAVYGKPIKIIPDRQVVINRSLNADRFRTATGYTAPDWSELIKRMYEFQ